MNPNAASPGSRLESATGLKPVSPSEPDASCRAPLLVLWTGATVWLVVASLFAMIASIKFHAPTFLADVSWLTYGRVHAAAMAAQLYGFALPAGFGVALWTLARLGDNRVSQPWLIAFGGGLWHFGVLVGVGAILLGGSTGFESLEMPGYAALILFAGFLMIGLWSALTLNRRRERRLTPVQWFLLTGLFWFAWSYSTANLLLLAFPVRGVVQAILACWYSENVTVVCLSLIGLATAFHFLEKLTGRALRDDALALFAYGTLLLFGSWAVVPGTAPVPAWMTASSTVATVMFVIPLLAVATILQQLFKRQPEPVVEASLADDSSRRSSRGEKDQTVYGEPRETRASLHRLLQGKGADGAGLRFIAFGVFAWLLAGALKVVAAIPAVNAVTQFTWYAVAQSQLNLYGFFVMTMLGAVYSIVPRVSGIGWPWTRAARGHFWCAAIGILLLALPLVMGGVVQGLQLNDAQIPFLTVAKTSLLFLRVSTLGDMLLLVGQLLFAANGIRLLWRYGRLHFVRAYRSVTMEINPAEVKS